MFESEQEPAAFDTKIPTLYSLSVGLVGLGVLGCRIAMAPEGLQWLPILVLAGLSLLVQRSSFHFGSPTVHSLAGVIDVSAVLILGPTGGAVVAAASGSAYLALNALHRRNLSRRRLVEIPIFDAGLKASMALVGGALFEALAGPLPLSGDPQTAIEGSDLRIVLAVCAVSLLWFLLDHVGWGILDYLEGGMERLHSFIQDAMPQAVLIELLPLPSSLVVALVYMQLGWPGFMLLSVVIVAVAVVTRHWAEARNELAQRAAELSTIEQVGRIMAQAQLDVDQCRNCGRAVWLWGCCPALNSSSGRHTLSWGRAHSVHGRRHRTNGR